MRNTANGEKTLIRYYSSIAVKKVDWLWEPYIPYGKITVVQGDPGDGKTTLILNIAALLSQGALMPESEAGPRCEKIIYQSSEDGAEDTLKPRLVSAGADCSKIAFIDESSICLTLYSPKIEEAIRETGARLLVLDPLQAYLGENSEMNRADGIRPAMKHLTAVAERTGCAIVIIGHMNKASGTKSIYRGLGSIDITASARSVLLVGRLKSDPAVRVMAQIKNSLSREGASIAFEINNNAAVRWIGEYDITADELLLGDAVPDDGGKLSDASEMLKDILRGGAVPCSEIYARFRESGIGKRTVDSAKKKLEIKSIKQGNGWYWSF